MPEYNVKVNGKTYRVKSDRPLQPAEAYQYASMQSGFKAPEPKPATRAEAKAQGKPRSTLENIQRYGRMAVGAIGDVVKEQAMPILANVGPGALLPKPARDMLTSDVGSKAIDYLTGREKLEKQIGPRTNKERLATEVGKGALSVVGPGGKKELAIQAVGGALGGGTAEALKQQGAGEGWQMAGGLLAGIVPSALASGVKQGVGKIGSYFTNEGAAERAASSMQQHAGGAEAATEAAMNIARRPRPSPGTKPTLGETARNPGLAALQREQASTAIQTRTRRNAQARARTLDTTFGEGDAQEVQRLAGTRVAAGEQQLTRKQALAEAERARIAAQHEAQLQGTIAGGEDEIARVTAANQEALTTRQLQDEQALAARQEAVHPELVTREQSAQGIRPVIKGAHQQAKDRTTEMYTDDLLVNPTDLTMKPREINRLFKGLGSKVDQFFANAGGSVPPKTRTILDDMLKELDADNLNTATIQNVDRRLADFAGEARVRGGSRNSEAAFAESLRDEIAARTSKHVPEDVAEQLALAKAAKRDESARFGSGTGQLGKVIDPKRYGFDKVKDTELARRLVTSGDPGATLGAELKAAVGDEAAGKLVAEEMRRLVQDGTIKSEANMRQYAPVLEQFPGIRDKVAEVVGHRTAMKLGITETKAAGRKALQEQVKANRLAERRATVEGRLALRKQDQEASKVIREQELANEAFKATPLGSTFGDRVDPTEAIGTLLSAKDGGRSMEILRQQVREGTDDTHNGVRRALAGYVDRALSQGAGFDELGNKIPGNKNGIAAIESVLERSGDLLDDTQRRALKQIQEELKAVDFAKAGGVAENVTDRLPTIPAKTGQVRNAIKALVEQFGNTDRMNDLIKEAILDPSFAPRLLRRPSPDRLRKIERTLRLSAAGALRAVNTTAAPPEQEQ